MENRPISSQQFSALLFLLLIGSVLVYVPGITAAQSAWIAILAGAVIGIWVLYAVISLHEMFPGQRITQISTLVLGKVPGTILNILFLWSIFIFACGLLYDFYILLNFINPAIAVEVLCFIIILTCVYCLYQGLNIIGRLGELSVWISLIFLILGIGIALPLADFSNLKPLASAWKPLAAGTFFSADWPFAIVVVLGLFLPLVATIKEHTKQIYGWYLISALLLAILSAETLAILGPELSESTRFPLFLIYRLIGFGEFRRLELIFLFLWLISGITPIIILYQGLNFIVQDIFRLKDYIKLILPLGLVLGVFTLYMFPSDMLYDILENKYSPLFTFPVNFLYPTLLLLAAGIQKKRASSKSTPGSAPARPEKPSLPATRPR
ncbi:MAG: GerAB/ArcD/ProY family transporter [Syntrophomonadaceae bacterium]|nr:GerAB/ArcD/ProY family transporter [Syntrophomonadaceae bacterium]